MKKLLDLESRPKLSLTILMIHFIILTTSFLTGELFAPLIILAGMFVFLYLNGKIKKSFLANALPLIAVFIVGLIGVINNPFRHAFRDIVYALNPIFLILIGYWIAKSRIKWTQIMSIIVFWGILFAIIHLVQFLYTPSLLNLKIDEIRQLAFNPGGGIIILSLVFAVFQRQIGFKILFPLFIPRKLAILILISSFILSFSRTGLVTLILLSSSLLGYIDRFNWKLVVSSGILLVAFIFIIVTTPADETDTFRGKIARTITELTISDYSEMKDIHMNWRGFETFRAIQVYSQGNTDQLIKGYGFGSLVDLGFTMTLNGIDFRKIPILHNGYAYILYKTGALGLILYITFYFRVLTNGYKQLSLSTLKNMIYPRLIIGLIFSLVLSMYVVGGMAEIHNSIYVLIIGYLLNKDRQNTVAI